MTRNKQAICTGIAVLLLLGACSLAVAEKAPTETVQKKIDEGALVVDVRTPQEYNESHFEGAININSQEFEARLDEFGPKDGAIIVYCRSGRRSGIVRGKLLQAGYTDVTNAGGLEEMAKVKRK